MCRRVNGEGKLRNAGNTVLLAMKWSSERSIRSMNVYYSTVQYTHYVMPHIYPTVSRRCNIRTQVPTNNAMQ